MIDRTAAKRIISLSKNFKVLLVEGSRQVGKTTLLQAIAESEEKERRYVSLDNRNALNLATVDPDGFFAIYPPPILIDEIQRAPALFLKIKEIVDSSEEKGLVWMTGSQRPKLKRGVDETLVGRVVDFAMYPLSQSEKQRDPYRPSFYPTLDVSKEARWSYRETIENVILGGYPALTSLPPEDRLDWYASYINHYLMGDILAEGIDVSEKTFRNLLKVLAARTATSLNISAVANDVKISAYKVETLISMLESCHLVTLLEPYSENVLKRVVKTPRLHFTDSGLCCYLLGIHTVDDFLESPLKGAIFESYAVSEVIRNARNNGDHASFYFYREENKGSAKGPLEIDLIKKSGGNIHPMEIKLNASPTYSMGKAFSALPEKGRRTGCIVCLVAREERLSSDLVAIPVSNI